ncbi:MAG: patatin-like phospholipase family protein [Rhodoferax sp.]|nr:patatin-like phospholipase family protein [Rhodoferax sp.]
MQALHLYAGPVARRAIQERGLQPSDVAVIAGAAGGPKGLLLLAMDRFLFGDWLLRASQPIDLVGASIGAWRMASACLTDPVAAFTRLEHDYIHQHYALAPGQKRPTAEAVSEQFGNNLLAFYGGRVGEVLRHPRYKLHIVTARGRHILAREHPVRTALGYAGAFMTNVVHRRAMGAWLERVVFSSTSHSGNAPVCAPLPFGTTDYRTRQLPLSSANFNAALQASCSIPFVLKAVQHIPGAPSGAYWDGGITDYHLHLNYSATTAQGIVLYPHFQKSVVPGWLDKQLKWRHRATHHLDRMLLLAPNPEWVKTLPNAKLPDRTDFVHYGNDLAGRVKAWSTATAASTQLVDEFARWLERPDLGRIAPL